MDKAEHEIQPLEEKLEKSIQELKQAWEIAGNVCESISIEVKFSHTSKALNSIMEARTVGELLKILKSIYNTSSTSYTSDDFQLMLVLVIVLGIDFSKLVHSFCKAFITKEKHLVEKQITSKVEKLQNQITSLKAAEEKLSQVLKENKQKQN